MINSRNDDSGGGDGGDGDGDNELVDKNEKIDTATTHNTYYVYLCDGYLYGYHIYFLLYLIV